VTKIKSSQGKAGKSFKSYHTLALKILSTCHLRQCVWFMFFDRSGIWVWGIC